MNKKLSIFLLIILSILIFASGCESSIQKHYKKNKLTIVKHSENSAKNENINEKKDILDGKTLEVYCEVGIIDTLKEITNKFEEETACDVEITYGNSATIKSKIDKKGYGDLIISGSKDELNSIKDKVIKSESLVKHEPVLIVKKGNPKKIVNVRNLTRKNVNILIGDYNTTSIGKVSKKYLEDNEISEKVNVVAKVFEEPELTNAIASGIGDAGIVWKENVDNSKVEIVDIDGLDLYTKTVSVATLSTSENSKALKQFMKFLNSKEAKNIWKNSGYELQNH